MSEYRDDRESLARFMRLHGLSPYRWAVDAGLGGSTVRNFINGQNTTMTKRSLSKLAEAAGKKLQREVTIGELIGETSPREIATAAKAISWLAAHMDMARPVYESDRTRPPMRLARSIVDRFLDGDASRGWMVEAESDQHAPAIRHGDLLLVDRTRIVAARDPGYYCVWNGVGVQLAHLSPRPGKRLFFMADSAALSGVEYDAAELPCIGRVVWRSGGL